MTLWPPAPTPLALEPDRVHLWRQSLSPGTARQAELRSSLDAEEIARAERLVTPALSRRFIAGRGFLRSTLARYLECAPRELRFAYGEHGKPRLVSPVRAGLRFNLTHSHDLAVLALVCDCEVGIDVEHVRPGRDLDDIARRYFAPLEVSRYEEIDEAERLRAFYRCWTRKEAYLKAKGGGLAFPLDRFVVAFGPGEAPAVLASELDPPGHAGWFLAEFDPGPQYAGAVCVEGDPVELVRYQSSGGP